MRQMMTMVLTLVLVAPAAWAADGAKKGEVDFEQAAKLGDSQKLSLATEYLSEMRDLLSSTLALLKEAREEKDVIKINCVNEKLTSIKGLLRISEQADVALQEAVAKNEKDTATHEFHKVSISHQKVKALQAEAEQCVGELAFAVGKTTVEVEVDGDAVPEADPTNVDLPDTPVVRPPAASPYI
ncbi:MAG TPA: hypothetical protein PK668_19735 [Myxococcota bacterium]|nr:hypothetical protein [Myxococcota bacterium]HRY95035.1 hypothetical protein [Myxococcota bacterium]HSA21094.1 hypothetical protein [Myxococcota bacterium]